MVCSRIVFSMLLGCCLAWFGPSMASAEVPASIDIVQVSSCAPKLNAYLMLLNEDGTSLETINPEALSVRIDGKETGELKQIPASLGYEGTAYTLLLDISGTISGSPFTAASQDIVEFIDQLNPLDVVSICVFGDSFRELVPFTSDKNLLREALATISPTDNLTTFYDALSRVLDINKSPSAVLPTRRSIIVITDGKDEGSGLTQDDILAKNVQVAVPIYSVGYSKISQNYLFLLKRLSELSGASHRVGGQGVNPLLVILRDRSYEIRVETDFSGLADGASHVVQVLFQENDFIISAERKVAFLYEKSVANVEPEESVATEEFPPVESTEPIGQAVAENGLKIVSEEDQAEDSPQVPLADELAGSTGDMDAAAEETPEKSYLLYYLCGGILLLLCVVGGIVCIVFRRRNAALEQAAEIDEPGNYDIPSQHESGDTSQVHEDLVHPLSSQAHIVPIHQMSTPVHENRVTPNCEFIVISDIDQGKRLLAFVSEEGVTLGDSGCVMNLPFNGLESPQCAFFLSKDRFVVKHLAGKVETILNGIPLEVQSIFDDGDVVQAGTLKLRFRIRIVNN